MTDMIRLSDQKPHSTVDDLAGGASDAVSRIVSAARQGASGVSSFRDTMRQAPLVMAFLMLGIGYILGSVTSARPPQRH